MKRDLLSALLICLVLLSTFSGVIAAPPMQEDNINGDTSEAADIIAQFLAGRTNSFGLIPETLSAEEQTATPEEPASFFAAAPMDPGSSSQPFGIGIDRFYSSLRDQIKNIGRHSVSFEEKGRQSASKVMVDEHIDIYLYYVKADSGNQLDYISFEADISDHSRQANAGDILFALINTVCNSYDIYYDQDMHSELYYTLLDGGSGAYEDFMIYGNTAEKGQRTMLTVKIYYAGGGYEKPDPSSYSRLAEDNFRSLISEFKSTNVIPSTSGSFYFHEDYETEWAQINWYQWDSFTRAKNFVISADIDWRSASNTPNYSNAGCGFVFRAADTSNHLYASINMDGKVHFGGIRGGTSLSHDEFAYGTHSTKGSAQLILVVNEGMVTAYVDGAYVGRQRNLAITGSGSLAFTVWSGTNLDYGTRCSFSNVYYYVF